MKCYKLTTQDCKTGTMQWDTGWRCASGDGPLCSAAFLHAYPSPLAAMLMNPIHARIDNPRLWVAEGLGSTEEDPGLKLGFKQLRLVEELLPPIVDQENRIRAALLFSLEVCNNPQWREFANTLLRGNMLTFRPGGVSNETTEELTVRKYAYDATGYNEVEYNSAMAIQCAAQYKGMGSESVEALFVEACGEYMDTPARGLSREGHAFRSSP